MTLPSAAALNAVADLPGLITLMGVAAPVWEAFRAQVGDPGADVRLLASLPVWIVRSACSSATFQDGSNLVPIHAAQVGLLWRAARKHAWLKHGGAEADFVDCEVWVDTAALSTTPSTTVAKSSIKENVQKMSALLDPTDESELLPAANEDLQKWIQRYVTLMGSYPEEEEEPSDGQLSALNRRTIVLGQAPYVDFSVWTPYARRALRTQKFRTYVPLGDGSFLMKELPGPQNLQQWMACWRVFKVAALALGILSMASLQLYEKLMEKLTLQYPSAWGLICLADDRARAERWEKIRRGLLADRAAGKTMPDDWNEDSPWTCCLVKLAKDDQYWSEQVRHPATAWIAAGGKGAPVAPAENIASSHHPGGQESLQPPKEDVKDERRKQANRDKRMARRKRVRDDRDELDKLRGNKSAPAGSKGSSKGKSKDSSGAEICFSWAQGKGACADVPVGGECKNKRSHRCQFCLSPGHRNDACPQK